MYYLFLIISALLFSTQFITLKSYQKNNGVSVYSSAFFNLLTSTVSVIISLLINKFTFEFTWFSIIMAIVYSLNNIVLSIIGIKSLGFVNLSLYTMFLMIGGTVVPFVYGIIIGEDITVLRIIGLIILMIANIIPIEVKQNKNKVAYLYYAIIFLLNGMCGVYTKLHQVSKNAHVSSLSFITLYSVSQVFIALSIILFIKLQDGDGNQRIKVTSSTVIGPIAYACINGTASFLMLICADKVDASIQYPVITGGCIIFSLFSGLLFKEKITKKTLLSVIVAFIATLFFLEF